MMKDIRKTKTIGNRGNLNTERRLLLNDQNADTTLLHSNLLVLSSEDSSLLSSFNSRYHEYNLYLAYRTIYKTISFYRICHTVIIVIYLVLSIYLQQLTLPVMFMHL